MSDTDMDLGFDEFEFDFDSVNIPDGVYAAEVTGVVFKGNQPSNTKPGETTTGIQLNFKLDTTDQFDGQFMGKYVWLHNNGDKPGPMGLRQFAAFVEAVTGEKPTGQLKLSAYGPQRIKNKKGVEEIHLTDLEGLRCAIQLETAPDKNGVDRTDIKSFASEASIVSDEDEDLSDFD